jgi:hypothetical protein
MAYICEKCNSPILVLRLGVCGNCRSPISTEILPESKKQALLEAEREYEENRDRLLILRQQQETERKRERAKGFRE